MRTDPDARGDPAPAASSAPPGPIRDRWALLVGVDRYTDPAIPNLRFCVRDVLALQAALAVEIGRDLADSEFIRNAYELAEGFALLAASTSQQMAQEWAEAQHGVFTCFLLERLSGKADRAAKGFVTVNDLLTHTLDGLRRWNVTHGGILQEPTARSEGLGDMILVELPAPGRGPGEQIA